MGTRRRNRDKFEYDVALSFAGENRDYVRNVARSLSTRFDIRVFYDEYKKVELWGKDLYEHLSDIYQHAAYYCVLFVSRAYSQKLWTNHERKSAQARAFAENTEYILPARFDDTRIPGLLSTVGYIDLTRTKPSDLAELIARKLGPRERSFHLPQKPDILFRLYGCKTAGERQLVRDHADAFVSQWKRMNDEERLLVVNVFTYGCPTELPANMHISLDFLKRETGFSISKIRHLAAGLEALGFECSVRQNSRKHRKSGKLTHTGPTLAIGFDDRTVSHVGEATDVVQAMFQGIAESYCPCCSPKVLLKGDFSALSSEHVAIERRRNH